LSPADENAAVPRRWHEAVARRAGWVVAISLLVVGAAGAFLADGRLSIDPSVERLLPERDEERVFYEWASHVFGSDETVLVVIEQPDLFTREGLERVRRVHLALEEVSGVQRVTSLESVPNLRSGEDGFEVRTFTAAALEAGADLEQLRRDALANPLSRGSLVSDDTRFTSLVITLEARDGGLTLTPALQEEIERTARAAAASDSMESVRIHVTGAPVLATAISQALLRELTRVLPAIALIGALVLALGFGRAAGVVWPLITVTGALLMTLAAMAALGRPLNLVTVIVPPLVTTLGLAYAMHVVSEFEDRAAASDTNRDARRIAASTLEAVSQPLAVAGLTTAMGLGALSLSSLTAIREFGAFSALGVVIAVALCLTLLPAGLALSGSGRPGRRLLGQALLERTAGAMASFSTANRRVVLAGAVALLALGALGATRIEVGTTYVENFDPDAPVRVQYETVRDAYGGANPFYIVIQTDLNDAFVDPDRLRAIEQLQKWLERQPEIGVTTSLVDHLVLLNRSVAEAADADALPDTQILAKQLLVFGGSDELDRVVDSRFRTANIIARASVDDSRAVSALLARVEERLAELPLPMRARITGNPVLVNRTVERIARGQLLSIAATIAVVYVILSALFTSFRVGALALLPNLIPIAVYFGTLGFLGIPLNPSTSLIAALALGIAVDDTIHYMTRFDTEARRHASEEQAVHLALRHVLRPITLTTLVLCLGFGVLMTSELHNLAVFGALCAFTLAVAWVSDVTITPALSSGVRIVTFWDVLRLDLGPEPHLSIPLMHGLSPRQARTTALILDMVHLEPGELLVREGEEGTDIFVVLEGELSLWRDDAGTRVEVERANHGAVVGAPGYFANHHPLNAEALTATRVIRFEDRDLEYLLGRHPRIAAHIYRNLNHIQAEFAVHAMPRIR
jgi:predicted RND superfamily exporter protein